MNGVGDMPPSMSQSLTGDMPACMTQSMQVTPSPSMSDRPPDIMTTSTNSLNFKTGKKSVPNRSRAEISAKEKEREEKVRRIREQQEEERKRKLEELKQHALQAQKFREQQENERRRHIDELRSKDMDRRQQVEERRKEIERSELERREAILAKNRDRETRLETQRKNSRGNIDFAFGSSAPRLIEPRIDSSSGYWGSRSVSGAGMFERSQRSAERELGGGDFKPKRTASAQGLDRSTEGISRENSTASRPGSAMSGRGGVRLRSAPGGARRPRPMSIATTGMTASMYEERQKPNHVPRQKSFGTPKADRMKRARSVTSDTGGIDDDNRSTTSSQSVGPTNRTPTRKTPSQVKAEAAARKAKATTSKPTVSTPKQSLGSRGATERKTSSKSPSPALSQDNIDNNGVALGPDNESKRQSTPDIIKDNNRKSENCENKDPQKNGNHTVEKTVENNNLEKEKSPEAEPEGEAKESKKIITSEEEAKARIAEKRREMKEQKEREAELERLRLEEEARLEQERLRQEEEEEKKMIAFAEEARKAEEERIRKAIEEKEAEEKRAKEEEERIKAEKEEMERKSKEEAEKREAELQEKLRKEEEERLARKKRIEEIMARTRGKGAANTPKKEVKQETVTSQSEQPASLDTNVDPTKPDLLGDISDKVEAENAKNLANNTTQPPSISSIPPSSSDVELEKGALDSISNKSEENETSSSLITIENGDETVKKSFGIVEGGSFDQILDLESLPDSNKAETEGLVGLPTPIIAFEESMTQQNNTADLLS